MAAEAPRTAVARIRIFISKGLGSPRTKDKISYFYDEETGQAHLTLYGRAFAYASQDRSEADAKEGVHRAALCRDILHTILKTFPQDRIQEKDLQRLAVEWQSMATLGPLPSTSSSIPPPPADTRPMSIPSRNAMAQSPSSYSPQVPAFLPPVVAARTLGNHSIVSPSTSTKVPSPASTSHSTPTTNLPPLDHRLMAGTSHSQPSTSYTNSLPPSISKASQGVQPVLPPEAPVRLPGAPAAMRAPAQGAATFLQKFKPAFDSRTTELVAEDEPPGFRHPDEHHLYRSLLRTKVPDTALQRIKWLCGVHLSRGKAPQVYKPYLDFHIEDRSTRLMVARSQENCEIRLKEDELYLLASNRGRDWLKEELARQAIKHGVFTKFTKMKMPKANVKSDMFAIVKDYSDLRTLKPNPKPTLAQLKLAIQGQHSPNISTSARPPITIASYPAMDPRITNAASPGAPSLGVNNAPARSNIADNCRPRDPGTSSTNISRALPMPAINGTPEHSKGAHHQTLPQPPINEETRTRAPAQSPPITTKIPPRTPVAPEVAAAIVNNVYPAVRGGGIEALETKTTENGDPLSNQTSTQASPSRDPRLQVRAKPPVARENNSLVVASINVQSVEAPMAALAGAPRSLPPLERPTSLPATSEHQTHETSPRTLADRTASEPQAEPDRTEHNAVLTPVRQSPASAENVSNEFNRQKPVRTPSLSERLALEPRESSPTMAEDQSLFARLQSDQSAASAHSTKSHVSNSSDSHVVEKKVEVPLLDRLVDREAELRRRIGLARRAPEQTGSRDEMVTDIITQVNAPAERPTEDTRGQMANSAASNEETSNGSNGVDENRLDRQEGLFEPVQSERVPDERGSAIATAPDGNETIPTLEHGSPKLTASQVALRFSRIHYALEPGDSRPILDQLKEIDQAEQGARSDREPTQLAMDETAAAERPVSLAQGVTLSAKASPEAIPTPAIPTASPSSPQEAPIPNDSGADAPSKTVQTENLNSRTALRLDNNPSSTVPDMAEASAHAGNEKQPSSSVTVPTRPRSGSIHSTFSGRSRGSRPETGIFTEDGKNKRRRDSGNAQSLASSHRSADDVAKRRRRSSPRPCANGSHESAASSMRTEADSRPSTPSMLYSNAQNMASILAKLAEGTLTYDQACEAMYALSLPASLDNAAFEALEAIWANSSAQLLQEASANFGMNCKSSDLVLMPKAWVQESMELLQKESSAS